MRLEQFNIKKYRSIEDITIKMPENKPLILFGPNNAGKSNILSAIDRILGEKYPTYIDVEDSDYFMRDKINNPTIDINATFDSVYYTDRYKTQKSYNEIFLTYGYRGQLNENLIHDGNGNKFSISNEARAKFQSFLLDADRSINFHFNYSNKYSLLSKFNKSLHNSLTDDEKETLSESYDGILNVFEHKSEFSNMFSIFKETVEESIKGFTHHLEADLSAYDPNNFAKNLRINACEGNEIRSFDEFGTGEQQILLMAFAKAYMEAFQQNDFLFILEEPEANLHPLAQKWLKKYIYDLCESGLQIIISTHSPNFINPSNLEGLVRVYKEEGITKSKQLDSKELEQVLIDTGVPKDKIQTDNLGYYFDLRLYAEQFEGLFAETVILVEGLTEKLALPIWLERKKYYLPSNGVEVVNCMGKANIPTLYRLYKSYGYRCICIFDGDIRKDCNDRKNDLLENILEDFAEDKIFSDDCKEYHPYITGTDFLCFGQDYEDTIKHQIGESYYNFLLNGAELNKIEGKQGKAKFMADKSVTIPSCIDEIIKILKSDDYSDDNDFEPPF